MSVHNAIWVWYTTFFFWINDNNCMNGAGKFINHFLENNTKAPFSCMLRQILLLIFIRSAGKCLELVGNLTGLKFAR